MIGRYFHGGSAVAIFLGAFGAVTLSAQQVPAPVQVDFADASLRDWVQPDYPEAAKKAKREGNLTVDFVVELDGRVSRAEVSDSTDAVFNEAALAAVRRWTFSPALENTKPVASGMTVPIEFRLSQLKQKYVPVSPRVDLLPKGLKVTPATFKNAPDPEYPAELDEQKLPGEVQIEFTVDAEGMPRTPRVLWASHAAFVESALRALAKSQFEPARQGPLAKAMVMQYPVVFDYIGVKRAEILTANHLTRVNLSSDEAMPMPFVLVDPVFPREHFLAGESGEAIVEFSLTEKGRTTAVTVVSASAPEYGAALLAAVQAWGFKPASIDGGFGADRLRVTYAFSPPSGGVVVRLAASLRPGGAGIGGPAGLDQKLKPMWRGFPVYPAALREEQLKGTAEIEFIIDHDGRVRLPRVVSATRDEFGWAAATAISQWVFEPPMRKGEPVDIMVTIPVSFVPPKL